MPEPPRGAAALDPLRQVGLARAIVPAALVAMAAYWIVVTPARGPFWLSWDDASYFLRAQHLHLLEAAGDWREALRLLRSFQFVPPLHSLLASLVYHAAGPTPYALTALSLATWLASVDLAARLAARQLGRVGGLAMLALAASAPLGQDLALRPMLESFGALLTVGFVLLYFTPEGALASGRRRVAAGLLLTAAIFTKYNYGLYLLLGLLAYHAACAAAALRRDGRRPARSEAAAACRFVVLYAGIPVLLWCLAIGRPGIEEAVRFFVNSPNSAYPRTDLRFWLFYVQAIPAAYFVSPLAGWAALGLAASRIAAYPRLPAVERWLAGYAVAVVALMTVSPNHQARYVFTVMPGLWLLALAALAPLARRAGRQPAARGIALAGLLALGAWSVGSTWVRAVGDAQARQVVNASRLGPALDFLRTRADAAGRIAIVGTFDELSAPLIVADYRARRAADRTAGRPDLSLDAAARADPSAAFTAWQARQPRDHEVVTIEVLPDSPYRTHDYARANAEKTPRMLRLLAPAYRVVDERIFPDAGLRLRAWRPT